MKTPVEMIQDGRADNNAKTECKAVSDALFCQNDDGIDENNGTHDELPYPHEEQEEPDLE